uniref:WD_REPEATS_REGION domain-containing protein n=1 Tax=Angiostrongylus cantonensis TaxID=6313 RepID=A0A158P5W7_ANGCA
MASIIKSKVHSEMEILEVRRSVGLSSLNQLIVPSECFGLQKTDVLTTRYFQEGRHVEDILGIKEDGEERDIWRRYSKERMKTVSVALVLCLHIARARLEAWVDPYSCNPQKAAFKIATSLQKSYERWQPRARYKSVTDPTGDDVRKLCQSMRRNAKDERVLFHYNGHGVPRPTQNGEIWVFNKNFTQYIPLSLFDLQLCMEFPSIYVWDCSSAETIVNWFMRFAKDHEDDWHKKLLAHQEAVTSTSISGAKINSHMTADQQAESLKFQRRPKFRDCIQLAACREDERLPTSPELPADLFTSCLTTPIHTSILYLIKNGKKNQFPPNLLDEIPGQLNDRRTILGELNWIFTAITDTIAWNALPRDDFQRLFRQDLLLASLFRSFLLAERVMSGNGCNVVSSPALPSTADHPLWDSWEYTLDLSLNHIHNLLTPKLNFQVIGRDLFFRSSISTLNTLIDVSGIIGDGQDVPHNWFFIEQLKAFEVWLEYGVNKQSSPEQLPIVLQVLLSQAHRQRALELLARFLDLGQWAVGYSLSVGIFPYMLKLLQSTSRELRTWLAFIWAKILAVDPSVQLELFKENGDEPTRFEPTNPILNDPDTLPRQKIVVAFVLASLFHNNYRIAQENLTKKGYVNLCTELLSENQAKDCRLLKLWILIGLGRLWADYDPARWQAVRLVAYAKVLKELDDNAPEVRAAAVYALGCLVKNRSETNEHAATIDQEICDELCFKCTKDGSVLVREELLIALQWYIIDFEQRFAKIFWDLSETLDIVIISDKNEDQFEHNVVDIAATLGESDATGSSCFQTERAIKQLNYLENKNFKGPLERTWLALLRLSLDPVEKIPKVETPLPSGGTSFDEVTVTDCSSKSMKSTDNEGGSESRSQLTDMLKQSFTPKRGTTARGQFSMGTPLASSVEPMLSSEFVPWCSRIFVQPILDLIHVGELLGCGEVTFNSKEEVEDFTDRALTLVNPTDWTIFVEQGQKQQAHTEFEVFKVSFLTVPCDTSLTTTRVPTCPTVVSFSMLRKSIYTTDGDEIFITRYEKTHSSLAQRFLCNGGNPFNYVWDLSYNIHSHEIEDIPQLVTASNPLCDQSRLPIANHSGPVTLYDWSQDTGRLVCGGNVRVIRVWDAHYERTSQDIAVAVRKGAVSALSGELDHNDLIAAGYRDGVLNIHDIRVSGKESPVMSFHDLAARIVGVAIRVNSKGTAIVAAADETGGVCVWEPRMFKVPVVEMESEHRAREHLKNLIVHKNAEMFGCIYNSEVRLYDICGVPLSVIRLGDSERGGQSLSAVAMHKLRFATLSISFDFWRLCSQWFTTSSWLGGVLEYRAVKYSGGNRPLAGPLKLRRSPVFPSGNPAKSNSIPGPVTILVPN